MRISSIKPKFGYLCLAAFLLVHTAAQAQSTITQTDTYSNVNDSITGNGAGGYTLTFNQFDSGYGTLTSVQILYTNVDVAGTVSVTNFSGVPRTYTNVQLQGNYSVTDANNNTVGVGLSSPTFTSASTFPGGVPASGTYTTPNTTNTVPGSASQTFSDAGTLALYTGTGTSTINLSLTSSNTGTATGTGSFLVSEASSGSGSVQIIYTYTPVPEPGTTAACMLALAFAAYGSRKFFPARQPCRI